MTSRNKKKILILGGAGFLGANLVRRVLKEPDIEITAVDSLEPRLKSDLDRLKPVLDRINFIQGDIRNETLLEKIIPGQDFIFQCAAQTSHLLSMEDPVFDSEVNCGGNLKILAAMKNYNRPAVIVYPSSSSVVGKAVSDVIEEDHWERPLDIYSANKGVAEKYYRIFHNAYDLKTVILRFANLYGPYGRKEPEFGFANYFINLAAAGQAITIYGDGLQIRNVMFVDDATELMWQAAKDPRLFGQMHFATHPDHYSVREFAEEIIKVFPAGEIKYIPWPELRKRIEIEKVQFSSDRLRNLTGWQAKHSLSEGLRLTKEKIAALAV